jgi:hypothetical protein
MKRLCDNDYLSIVPQCCPENSFWLVVAIPRNIQYFGFRLDLQVAQKKVGLAPHHHHHITEGRLGDLASIHNCETNVQLIVSAT